MIQETSKGNLKGYKHHEISANGMKLKETSEVFYRALHNVVHGKEVVFRVLPYCSESESGYKFFARVHVKEEQK